MSLYLSKKQTLPRRTKPLSIKANMLWNSAGSFIYVFAQWVTTVLVVRMSVGFDAAGVYTYVMSVYMIFASVADYRMYPYQVSDTHDENSMGEYFAFKCLTCGISVALTMVYSFATSEPSLWLPIFVYIIYKDLSTILDTFHAEEQKKERMDYMGISIGAQGIGSLVCFWVVFALTQDLTLTFLSMAAITLVIGVVYDFPRSRWFSDFAPKITFSKARTLLIRCLPGVIAYAALSASSSVPRQLLLNIMGESALGLYGTIAAPLAVIQMCASFLYNPFLGYFTVAYEENDSKRFSQLMLVTIGGTILIGILCAIVLLFFGDFLYSLIFGSEVLPYMYLIPLLIISYVGISFATFLNTLMVALRNFKASLAGGLVALFASLATMVPCIYAFELNGATIALIIATIVSTVVMGIMLARQLRTRKV